ncbi:MAG TPA: hypothetical protein VGH22_14915 [Candidatus Binatia bacterium]|jgi:hypothetical protein
MNTLAKNKLRARETIFAYGFDQAGFATTHDLMPMNSALTAQFVGFYSSRDLNDADGVIIPQGIFEKIETRTDLFSGLFGEKTFVLVDKSLMLERERQIFNLLRDGKWVCFLVGEITDQIAQGLHSEPIFDTDLCKRILNAFMIDRRRRYRLEIPLDLKIRDEEFELYMKRYGRPTTVFELPQDLPMERHAIAWLGSAVVGMEIDAQLFFLPFESSRQTLGVATDILSLLAPAISQYRRDRITTVPDWVDDFHFKSEEPLYLEVNDLLGKLNRLESELASWKDYKAILASSGIYLRNKIVALFESVFGLKVQCIDREERFFVLKEDDSPLALVQSEGTEGPVQTASLDRLAHARSEHHLSESFPLALLINNDMAITNIGERSAASVAPEVLEAAVRQNILIIRTIDLLFLLNHLEKSPNKKARILHLLTSGRGWLKASAVSYDVMHP